MRVFAAIEIPDSVKKKILDASKYFAFRDVTLVKENALHITLQFFGEIGQNDVNRIISALDSTKMPSFNVTVHGIGFFKPERIRVVYAGVSGGAGKISELHNLLIRKLNIRDEERFVPHVTIARVKGMRDRRAFTDLVSEYEDYDFGSFDVGSVTLKNSVLSSDGPFYSELHKSDI